jgi:hypothetical protein
MSYETTIRLKREELNNQVTYPCGRVLRKLSEHSYELVDMLGKHLAYLRNESVTVHPSLLEQRLAR